MIALLLLSIVPQPSGTRRDTVDIIELNHLYADDDCSYQCDQLIFWIDTPEGFRVLDYRTQRHIRALPKRDWQNGGYRLDWHDVFEGHEAYRTVRCGTYHESWTTNSDDPEKLNREKLPKEKRRLLKPGVPIAPNVIEIPTPPADGA